MQIGKDRKKQKHQRGAWFSVFLDRTHIRARTQATLEVRGGETIVVCTAPHVNEGKGGTVVNPGPSFSRAGARTAWRRGRPENQPFLAKTSAKPHLAALQLKIAATQPPEFGWSLSDAPWHGAWSVRKNGEVSTTRLGRSAAASSY